MISDNIQNLMFHEEKLALFILQALAVHYTLTLKYSIGT